jgi:cytochrome c peroxidase
MGGSGLDTFNADRLDRYIDQLPAAENPLRTSMSTEAVVRGKAAFEKASCNTCHTGALLTNNTNADVGTIRLSGANPDNGDVMTRGFNVPSLLGVGRTAPYLHDGSQLTLAERVLSNTNDKHGTTSVLSASEKDDLIAYLKSL